MTITVVTSCSAKGWTQYGERCIAGIVAHWPKEITVCLVSEDANPLDKSFAERVKFFPLHTYPAAIEFYKRHETNRRCHGFIDNGRGTGYNFRFDAYRFSKKVFAIGLIASLYPKGKLFWLDADTVTFKDVPIELFSSVLPDECDISFLDRPKYHSECGFVGYNLQRPMAQDFISKFVGLYEDDNVFKLKEWHDSFVFDQVRKALSVKEHKIPHTNISHPFVYSELGLYLDHLKGTRKGVGVSLEHPRFNRRKPKK